MSTQVLEARVAVLEHEVADLKQRTSVMPAAKRPWWEDIVGVFADDPAFEEAMALGEGYRAAQRPRDVHSREVEDVSA